MLSSKVKFEDFRILFRYCEQVFSNWLHPVTIWLFGSDYTLSLLDWGVKWPSHPWSGSWDVISKLIKGFLKDRSHRTQFKIQVVLAHFHSKIFWFITKGRIYLIFFIFQGHEALSPISSSYFFFGGVFIISLLHYVFTVAFYFSFFVVLLYKRYLYLMYPCFLHL